MERLLVTNAMFGDREYFDYQAAYLVERPHSVIDELNKLNIPVTRLGSGSATDPRWLLDLVRLVRSERIDVVHAHSPMPASMARPVFRLTSPKARFVYTEHNRWDRFSTPTRWANMITFPLNHWSFAVSEDCRQSMPSRLQKNVETLIHGIDIDAVSAHKVHRDEARTQLGIGKGTIVIGTVANLRRQKNYPLLLQVAATVVAENSNVVFLSVGQGPLEADLKALHVSLGLGDRFRFLGFRSDVHSVMSAFDIFCLSSDHEGLPVALMEAKALGLPVVATDVGGLREGVVDGVDGILVPPGQAALLGAALSTLIRNDSRRQQIGAESLASSVQFAASAAVARQETIYRGDETS